MTTMTGHVMNMREVLRMSMTTVIERHSFNYDIFNANMTFLPLL